MILCAFIFAMFVLETVSYVFACIFCYDHIICSLPALTLNTLCVFLPLRFVFDDATCVFNLNCMTLMTVC